MGNYYNFFELQRYHKRNSLILYALFVLAMMIHVLMAWVVFMILWYLLFGTLDEFAWFWVFIIVPAYFLLSVSYQYHKYHRSDELLKGLEVKRLFINVSGQAINTQPKNTIYANEVKELPPAYRRYHQFAEQLAIACHIALPKLYVMDEQGINAFVAGFDDEMILVLSEGALKLDNESLYGLIAHEYGHIIHGDHRLNMKMFVLMSGLSWLYDVADGLEWLSHWRQTPKVTQHYYRDDLGNRQSYIYVTGIGRLSVEFVSLLIRLVGFLGMACSEWIKQHFNREREFLADATAIQLTRSDGVLKLLNTLKNNPYLTHTKKHYTTHLSYFFFLDPINDNAKLSWREQIHHLGKTHPQNDERIYALKHGHYEDFAKIATQNLDDEVLQNTHDKMMMFDEKSHKLDIIELQKIAPSELLENGDKMDKDDDFPIYQYNIEISDDKVVHGRFVRDKSWDKLGHELLYPQQARADYEIKAVKYVNINHVRAMHLPLIINKFLRNDNTGREQSKLFDLYYALLLCHHAEIIDGGVDIYLSVYLSEVLFLQDNCGKITINQALLKAVAYMDRRVDNGLLLMIYRRLGKDIKDEKKRELLKRDYDNLRGVITHHHTKNSDMDGMVLLWQGVHLYRLLAIYDGYQENHLSHELNATYQKYSWSINEFIVIVLLIYVVICHKHQNHIQAIYHLMRLINHKININEQDIHNLIGTAHTFGVMDLSLLLLNYEEQNLLISKRHIETLHTALLIDGVLCERDYEILLTLHDKWCNEFDLMIY